MSTEIEKEYFDLNLYEVEPPILPESNEPFTVNEDRTIDLNLTGIATFQKNIDVVGDVRIGIDANQGFLETTPGVILTSPIGAKYRIIVDDSGVLSTVLVL
jgi:hypothetical protein